MIPYTKTESFTGGEIKATVSIFLPEEDLLVESSHRNFDKILEILSSQDEYMDDDEVTSEILHAFSGANVEAFTSLTGTVSVSSFGVYYNGKAVSNKAADAILAVEDLTRIQDRLDATTIANFLEKAMKNPNPHAANDLFEWICKHDFVIYENGDFGAYKGVHSEDGRYLSTSSGRAVVDGVPVEGRIPTKVGSTVTMPREDVLHDPDQFCGPGLHAGTYEYASYYGDTMVLCRINPEDVVSIPRDANGQKIRVCKYYIDDFAPNKRTKEESFVPEPEEFDDGYGFGFEETYGEDYIY